MYLMYKSSYHHVLFQLQSELLDNSYFPSSPRYSPSFEQQDSEAEHEKKTVEMNSN